MNKPVCFSLIAINVAVFIWMAVSGVSIMSPSPGELVAWGGSINETLLQGEWWRLFTCMFLHSGIFHLLVNMYTLYQVGLILESTLGSGRFIIAYLCSGLIASVVSALFHANSFIVGVGASGAIFGLFGALLALVSTQYFEEDVRLVLGKSIALTLVMNVMYGFKAGIDLAAHAGGFIAGLIIGYCLYLSMTKVKKGLVFSLVALVTGGSMALGIAWLQNDDAKNFYRLKDEMAACETQIQEWGSQSRGKPDWQFEAEINFLILPKWEKMKKLAGEMNGLKLSGDHAKFRNYAVKLIDLQAEKFDLLARSLHNDTDEQRLGQIQKEISELSMK